MGERKYLTANQAEVVRALEGQTEWLRPMDVGGYDGSHHSSTLRALWKKGIVDRRRRGTLANYLGSHRGGYEYRLRDQGTQDGGDV